MASEPIPSAPAKPTQPWFARLGLGGKLLAIGGAAGIIVGFLPLMSASAEMMGMMRVNQTAMVVDDWRGMICMLGYLAALVSTFVLFPPGGLRQKERCWAVVGIGLLVVLLAIWLLMRVLATGSADMMGMGSLKSTVGIGAFLNVLTAGTVAAGGLVKARDEMLI